LLRDHKIGKHQSRLVQRQDILIEKNGAISAKNWLHEY